MIDPNKMTEMARKALQEGQSIARRNKNNEVETLHLLAALAEQKEGIVQGVLEKLEITPSAMAFAIDREIEKLPKVSGSVDSSKIYVTKALNDVFDKAENEAESLKDEYISVEHLFLGLVEVAAPSGLAECASCIERGEGKSARYDAESGRHLSSFGEVWHGSREESA